VAGGNTLAARQAALRDAMRKAVEKRLGTLVESRTMVENFALVNDRIYSQASGFVSDYEILSEGEDRGSYQVSISAVVNMAKLGDDARAIGLLQAAVGYPTMMIMIDEYWWDPGTPRERQRPVDDPASAAKIAERFLGRGFDLVDQAMARQLRSSEMMMMDELMNSGALVDLAKKAAADYAAEVLIVGMCKIEAVTEEGGRYTASAVFDAKAVDASTGALIAAKQFPQTGAGVSPEQARSFAAQRAGDAVADAMIDQILQYWQNKANNGVDYVVKLYGVGDYGQQGLRFIKAVKELAGVVQAKRRAWDSKLGRLEVDSTY